MSVQLWAETIAGQGVKTYRNNVLYIDSHDYVHIVDNDGRELNKNLKYGISINGGTSFSTETIESDVDYDDIRAGCVVDTSDNVYAFYGDLIGADHDVHYYKGSAGNWGSSSALAQSFEDGFVLNIDTDDNILIAGGDSVPENGWVYSTVDSAANWVQEVSDTENSGDLGDFSMDSNQNVWWIHGDSDDDSQNRMVIDLLTKTEGTPDSWARTQKYIDTTDERKQGLAIVVESNNTTIWAFMSYVSGGTKYLKYIKSIDSGTTWGSWTEIDNDATNHFIGIQAIRDDDDNIYLKYEYAALYYTGAPTGTTYYRTWNGSSWGSETTLKTTSYYCVIQNQNICDGKLHFTYCSSGTSGYLYYDNLSLTTEAISDIDNDFRSAKLWALDDVTSDFRMVNSETTNDVTNDFRLQGPVTSDVTNDFRFVDVSYTFGNLTNDFRMTDEGDDDLDNDFRMIQPNTNDIDNDFRFYGLQTYDMNNKFSMVGPEVIDINNDFRMIVHSTEDLSNDFRMIQAWQKPAGTEFESLGKEYMKVYIDDVEQTDVDVDSISISRVVDGASTCRFSLGRAYDGTQPDKELKVQIKYHIYVLYTGYITEVTNGDSPESISVMCKDKYWLDNRTSKYFFVGHQPPDETELYYSSINAGLGYCGCGSNFSEVGNFVPQTINCFGIGTSDVITNLVNRSGNYHWFYDVNENKKLWKADKGNIVNLTAQEIGTNLGLYQVLNHNINESIDGLYNKMRVQIGNEVIKRNRDGNADDGGGATTRTYTSTYSRYITETANSGWESSRELLTSETRKKYGYDYPKKNTEWLYNDVFTRYLLPNLDPKKESWEDEYPPIVKVHSAYSNGQIVGLPHSPSSVNEEGGTLILDSGFSIDYARGELLLAKPLYVEELVGGSGPKAKEIKTLHRVTLELTMWKTTTETYTTSPTGTGPDTEDPEEDVSNELMFFTDKMGDYATTIFKSANYSQFSKQIGGDYKIENPNPKVPGEYYSKWVTVPSWDDTSFAKDYANWELSKHCDVKLAGSIQLTLDALCFYGIDLNSRINIDGITDSALNIESITYNLSNFTATVSLKSARTYQRTENYPYHGA